jgi:hypothetical protein
MHVKQKRPAYQYRISAREPTALARTPYLNNGAPAGRGPGFGRDWEGTPEDTAILQRALSQGL